MSYQDDFVQQMLPYAVAIGDQYGLDPITIITQAAIETGWGREVSGNNYFGVKSHGRPGGHMVTTHEEVDGKRVKIQDSFRQYGSMEESVADYAEFLKTNPRYAAAFTKQGHADQLASIVSAGYATDSNYQTMVNGVSAGVKKRIGPLPPGSIPTVGTMLDVAPGPKVAPVPNARMGGTVARTNAELGKMDRVANRPVPMDRMDGTVARTNAAMNTMESAAATPLPRSRPDRAPGMVAAPVASQPTQQAMLPELGAPGSGRPVMPASAAPALPRPRPDNSARSAAAPQVPSGGMVGQTEARPVAAPASVAAPMPEKYIVTYERKEIPLGDVMHKGSRDTVKQAADGKAAAETTKFVNRKVTTLNPEWVTQQAAPAVKPASPAPNKEQNLGEQIVGGIRSAVGIPAEGFGGQIVGGARQALGIPAAGMGPGIMGGIRTAIGIPADGIGPGIQRWVTGLGNGGRTNAPAGGNNGGGGGTGGANNRSDSPRIEGHTTGTDGIRYDPGSGTHVYDSKEDKRR